MWPKYQEAYQAMLDRTSTDYAPWHVVPCDRKWYSRLAVTELLIEALEGLNLSWPPADFDVEAEKKRLARVLARLRYLTRVNCPTLVMPRRKKSAHPVR